MKERPILFFAPMVRAILDGRKTQTRRVIKPQPSLTPEMDTDAGIAKFYDVDECIGSIRCPYGVPGDRLWVKETWGVGTRPDPFGGWRDGIEYLADADGLGEHDVLPLHGVKLPGKVNLCDYREGWHSPLFMPRWASRISLEITDVRVQRVREISEEDARAEGIEPLAIDPLCPVGTNKYTLRFGGGWHNAPTAREVFRMLWNHIHGPDAWERNEWVWAVTFKPIDAGRSA